MNSQLRIVFFTKPYSTSDMVLRTGGNSLLSSIPSQAVSYTHLDVYKRQGWALVVNNSSITADRITVYGVVDGPIADAALLHTSDDFFESVQIL